MSSYNCLFHAVTKALGRGGHTNLRSGVSVCTIYQREHAASCPSKASDRTVREALRWGLGGLRGIFP